jgi:hypothetical protein
VTALFLTLAVTYQIPQRKRLPPLSGKGPMTEPTLWRGLQNLSNSKLGGLKIINIRFPAKSCKLTAIRDFHV